MAVYQLIKMNRLPIRKNPGVTKRSRYAQSRIDYIVYGNPAPVRKLVSDFGYEVPEKLKDLREVVKDLIREEGKSAVVELVKLHPDREAILGIERKPEAEPQQQPVIPASVVSAPVPPEEKTEAKKIEQEPLETKKEKCSHCGKLSSTKTEDSYCGCNHSYNDGSTAISADDLTKLTATELMARYENLTKQSASDPENKSIAEEATRTWNQLRQRNQNAPAEAKASSDFTVNLKEAFFIIGITMLGGLLIGVSVMVVRQLK